MRRILTSTLTVGLMSIASVTDAATIDFNDGIPEDTIGGFYSGVGVTFSNARWRGPFSAQDNTPSTGNSLYSIAARFKPKADTAIIGTFDTAVSSVSILAFDIGANGAQIDVYDAAVGGNLLASDSFIGTGVGVGTFHTLAVASPNILRFEVYQPLSTGGSDGVVFDDLNFIPEPAVGVLIALGGLVGLSRRSNHAQSGGRR